MHLSEPDAIGAEVREMDKELRAILEKIGV